MRLQIVAQGEDSAAPMPRIDRVRTVIMVGFVYNGAIFYVAILPERLNKPRCFYATTQWPHA